MLLVDKNKRGSGIVIRQTQASNKEPVELIAGIDAGSTQTRVCLADAKDAQFLMQENVTADIYERLKNEVYVIPSMFSIVGDEREIKPNSENLEDNYDSRVVRLRTSAVKPLISSERILRGQKIKDTMGLPLRYLDSSTNKMDNNIFYLNVLDGIGYALLQKYNGSIPQAVNIHLVLSVRPKELNSICTTKMDENFIGNFIFNWQSISITLNIVSTTYTTEPEAQLNGTAAIMDLVAMTSDSAEARDLSQKFANSDSYIHIEGGGSSIGVEVVKQGNIIDAASSTFQLGGNYLVRMVLDRIRDVKGRAVSEESVKEAIETCLLRNGREREDISDIIASAKNQVGLDIIERLRHDVIDVSSDMSLLDMDFITLGGRLFNDDMCGNSIGTYFAEYLRQISPNTEVIVLHDNFIPQGNLIIGIREHELQTTESASVPADQEPVAVAPSPSDISEEEK